MHRLRRCVRELFDKEKDLDALSAVKDNDPDHLHGILCMAAIKRGKHVLVHKPRSNRLIEGKKLIGMSQKQQSDHAPIPWDSNGSMETVMAWINAGAIGTLQEANWTNRPVWPQYADLPPINQRCRKALMGSLAWARGRPAALFSQLYKYGVQGLSMISAVAPWQTWATIVCGRF